jgi:hypothetical protein
MLVKHRRRLFCVNKCAFLSAALPQESHLAEVGTVSLLVRVFVDHPFLITGVEWVQALKS